MALHPTNVLLPSTNLKSCFLGIFQRHLIWNPEANASSDLHFPQMVAPAPPQGVAQACAYLRAVPVVVGVGSRPPSKSVSRELPVSDGISVILWLLPKGLSLWEHFQVLPRMQVLRTDLIICDDTFLPKLHFTAPQGSIRKECDTEESRREIFSGPL